MARELWVAGYPSFCGGADTELDHNIDLWRRHDVDVHLVPMFGCDERMKKLCDDRSCHTHKYNPSIFKDRIVVSFCNGQFLERLPEIMHNGRPKAVVWFNCMTWQFKSEIEAHQKGWITHFGFVSRYQRSILKPQFEKIAPVRELEDYQPYFSLFNRSQQFDASYRAPEKYFGCGRVSRDDGNKYSSDMWSIFNKVCTPIPKKVFILGFGPNALAKAGPAPAGLDWQTWLPGEVPVKELYSRIHVAIHKTGGSRESYCRIVAEAYASGVVPIVEDDYAFPELVIDGETGFRCKSSDEMSFRASELAFDEQRRKKMLQAGGDFLVNVISSSKQCWKAWEQLWS